MDLVSLFNSVRDIPYRIPLKWGEEDNCCSGKHEKLYHLLTRHGYKVRYRVCVFKWKDLGIPSELEKIPHDGDCTHTYLEIKLNGNWRVLDATWDIGLKELFHVNIWDGRSDTKIAVKYIKIFSPEKSLDIVNNQDKQVIEDDLRVNREFYKVFNEWLDNNRKATF
ncbi:hypothetical protein ACFLQO_00495 [Candidatus Aenigmatarchaeota archaeon]